MTINNPRGQTLQYTGINLRDEWFTQISYMSTAPEGINQISRIHAQQRDRTVNIVYEQPLESEQIFKYFNL